MKRSEAIDLIFETLSAYIELPSDCREASTLVLYMLEEAGIQAPDVVCEINHEWESEN